MSCWKSGGYNDISVPIEQFRSHKLKCNRIFIIENNMNYLTFPDIPNSIAVWGRGFAIGSLKNINWLDEMDLYYWGDLGAQDFQMVSQIRKYYGQVKSFLMDSQFLRSLVNISQ
ncbi:DUF2220 domain-containing protein [Marivirga tractuosa]|uniref:DUF2220 domain-containing protein n=1 Tax=Marivirga tractuosa TaxID=1006 RepID=UPI0035D0FF1D